MLRKVAQFATRTRKSELCDIEVEVSWQLASHLVKNFELATVEDCQTFSDKVFIYSLPTIKTIAIWKTKYLNR